jgi:hypothetical protein
MQYSRQWLLQSDKEDSNAGRTIFTGLTRVAVNFIGSKRSGL